LASIKRAAGHFHSLTEKHQFDVKLAMLKIIACRFYAQQSSHSKGQPDFNRGFETLTSSTTAMYKPFLMLLLAFPLAASASCDPTAPYFRGASGAYANTFEVSRMGDEYELQLDTYGQKLSDGNRTFGAIRGRLELSQNGCAGAYLAPDEECSVFIMFNRSGAEVHQFGSCLFGYGASAGGTYRRLRPHGGQRGLTHSSSGMRAASVDANR
jgi:hypothetical protein